jgi:hypothetical protein
LGGPGAALADETGIEPLPGDALELAEEVQLRFFARIAPMGVEESAGEMKQRRRLSMICCVG